MNGSSLIGGKPEDSGAWWRCLLQGGTESRRFLLALLVGVLAVHIGFVAIDPPMASRLVEGCGYYYILGVFVAFLTLGYRLVGERRAVVRGWLRRPGWPGVCILAGSVLLVVSDTFGHKVLFDEYVLQSTADHIHMTKEIGTYYRAFHIEGTFVPIDPFLDKRPYFFAFLVSLLHDLTGFRLANLFALNVAMAPVFLGLAYYFAKSLSDRRGGMLAVALLATLPLLSQNVTGAGMEMHNLTMLALTMCAALLYLRKPDETRLAFLCLSAVLLSQSRYESAIYAVSVIIVILAGWHRARRPLLPWTAIVTPMLFVPYAWHNRVLSANPTLWQLKEGQTSRFSAEYLPGNLDGMWRFFFNFGNGLPNSWYLSILGVVSLVFILVFAWLRARRVPRREANPAYVALAAFGLGVLANLGMLMFYYWARLDDISAVRFSLPSYLMLALCSAVFVWELSKRWSFVWKAAMAGVGVYVLVAAIPMEAKRRYTAENLVAKVVVWEMDVVATMPTKPRLVVANRSTMPWILNRIPSIIFGIGRIYGEKIRYHMEQGTFQEVLVTQTLRPISADGTMGVDAEDVLPPSYHLECVAEKRFGVNICRISRLIKIDPPEPGKDTPK
ncbi:MAG: glycosyltransferase family 39 protein [Opitutaceae bacterium]|jgi:hypothetical protein